LQITHYASFLKPIPGPDKQRGAAALADHKETLICSKFVSPCRFAVPVHISTCKLRLKP